MQANCQFVVRAGGDYSRYAADPDLLVDWTMIEQVRLRTSGSEPTSCPICLFPPTAAKISRCGHVFCWPCILHYLALSDDNWRKCPICYDSIQKADLKSVVTLAQADYATGGEIEMRLMRRERNSLLAVPAGQAEEDLGGIEPDLGSDQPPYVKLIKASRVQVANSILAKERSELEFQLAVEGDQPESCFIQEALALLLARELEVEEKWNEVAGETGAGAVIPGLFYSEVPAAKMTPTNELMPESVLAAAVTDATVEEENNLEDLIQLSEELAAKATVGMIMMGGGGDNGRREQQRPRHASSSSDVSSEGEDLALAEDGGEAEATITAEDLDISSVQPLVAAATTTSSSGGGNGAEKPAPKNVFYFYQSSDGQPIFLHALNVQMLVQEYGTLENCPPLIRASILEKDSSTMTEELRDRLRYLRHLPVASSFEVAELDLGNAIVSKATVAKFREQLDSRRRKRARKQREERRRERRIAAEEMRLMGRFPGPMVRIESAYHYPQLGQQPPAEAAIQERHRRGAASPTADESTEGSVGLASPDLGTSPCSTAGGMASGPSFAKIIRDGVARSGNRPVLAPRSVLEEVGMQQQQMSRVRRQSEDGDDDISAPPPPTASLGDALAAALARAETRQPSGATGNNKKKGKKGRGCAVLLSGGPARPRL